MNADPERADLPGALRLVAEELSCTRGGRPIFASLSFALATGEALAVVGPNGAGKSSLLRLIAGLLPKAGGRLTLEGGDSDRSIGECVHYAGHAEALKPALTARETLAFWRAIYGDPRLAPEDALDRLGIGHLADLPAAYFSAGQKRRLALARLLVSYRPIWLLDEPTSALDLTTQARLAALMQAHLDTGGMILAATHGGLGIGSVRILEIAA